MTAHRYLFGVLVVLCVLTACVSGASATTDTANVSIDELNAVETGENVTIPFSVTNTGDGPRSYLLDVTLPESFDVVDRDDENGRWRTSGTSWLWKTIEPGETVEPWVSIGVPEDAGGEYLVEGAVRDVDGEQAADAQPLEVGGPDPGAPPVPFDVEIVRTNSPVAGEALDVDVAVENGGSAESSQPLVVYLAGVATASTEVTRQPGERSTETVSIDTDDAAVGDYVVSAEIPGDTHNTSVEILADGPPLELAIESTNAPVRAGESLEVDVVVAAESAVTDQPLRLETNGTVADETAISLASGDSTSITLHAVPDADDVPQMEIAVSLGNASSRVTESVTVDRAPGGSGPGPITTPTPPIQPASPEPTFTVADLEAEPAAAGTGAPVEIEALIENSGADAGTVKYAITLEGDVLVEGQEALAPGERREVSADFEMPTSESAVTVEATTQDDRAAVSVESAEPTETSESDVSTRSDADSDREEDDELPGFTPVSLLMAVTVGTVVGWIRWR